MQWRPVPGFENHYSISERGDVVRVAPGPRTKPGRVLRPAVGRNGYLTTRLFVQGTGSTRLIHRLVATVFHGPPPAGKPMVRHLDGDPRNNHFSNLRWGDAVENAQDKRFHDEHGRGVTAP